MTGSQFYAEYIYNAFALCAPTGFIDIVRKKFIIMQNFVKGVYKNAVY